MILLLPNKLYSRKRVSSRHSKTYKSDTTAISKCRIISGLEPIHVHYQAFLIDAWGVLHDGQSPYPYALDCLEKLLAHGKKVIILSNAARRCKAMVRELESFGIKPGLYQAVLSSGELTWHSLHDKGIQSLSGYYLGPTRSRGLLEGLQLNFVDQIDRADFILNTGAPQGNPSTVIDSEALLKAAASRNLPMICANPDQVAMRGGQLGISAGALAQRYAELGANNIQYHGKPYQPIYQQAFKLLNNIPLSQVLAVGDAFDTDIRGGQSAQLDTCLIAAGIHYQKLLPLSTDSLQSSTPVDAMPDYTCEYFSW